MIIAELNYLEAVSTTSLLGGTVKCPPKPPKKCPPKRGHHSSKTSNITQKNFALNVAVGGSISNYQENSATVRQ